MYHEKELNIENESLLLTSSDLSASEDDLPLWKARKSRKNKKKSREALGSVNLRTDEETKKYEEEIKKMEDDKQIFTAQLLN